MDGLKHKAKQAVRYRTVSQQVRTAEAMLFHLRFINAQAETVEAERAQDEAVRLVADPPGRKSRSFDPPGQCGSGASGFARRRGARGSGPAPDGAGARIAGA